MKRILSAITTFLLMATMLVPSASALNGFSVHQENLIQDPVLVINYNGETDNLFNQISNELGELVEPEVKKQADLFNSLIANNKISVIVGGDNLETNPLIYFIIEADNKQLLEAINLVKESEGLEEIDYKGNTIVSSYKRDDFAATYNNGAILLTDSPENLQKILDTIEINSQMNSIFNQIPANSMMSAIVNYEKLAGVPELEALSKVSEYQFFALEQTGNDMTVTTFSKGNKATFDAKSFNYSDFSFKPALYKEIPGATPMAYIELNNLYELIDKSLELSNVSQLIGPELDMVKEELAPYKDLLNGRTAFTVQFAEGNVIPHLTLVTEYNSNNVNEQTAAQNLTKLITDGINSELGRKANLGPDSPFCQSVSDEMAKITNEISLKDDPNSGITGFTEEDPGYDYFSNLTKEELITELDVAIADYELFCSEEKSEISTDPIAEDENATLVTKDFSEMLETEGINDKLEFTYGILNNTHYVLSNYPDLQSNFGTGSSLAENSTFTSTFNNLVNNGLNNELLTVSYFNPASIGSYIDNLVVEMGVADPNDEDLRMVIDFLNKLSPWASYSKAENNYDVREIAKFNLPVDSFIELIKETAGEEIGQPAKATFSHRYQFSDVDFDNPEGVWYAEDLIELANEDIIKGADGEFKPGNSITRAEFITMLVRYYSLDNNCLASDKFNDVETGSWYDQNICAAFENGLIKGDDNGVTVRPNAPITRAEATQILANFSGVLVDAETDNNFNDVSESDWYYEAVGKAYNKGIVEGRNATSFDPTSELTRAEAAALINRIKNREVRVFRLFDVVEAELNINTF